MYSHAFSQEICQSLLTFYVKTIPCLGYYTDTIQVTTNSNLCFPTAPEK